MYSSYDAAAATGMAAFMGVYTIVVLVIGIIAIVACWKIFTKAGEPGWASIVPFYSQYVLFKIAMGNGWFFLLQLVPLVNVVIAFLVYIKLAQAFGKGVGFGLGLIFLNPIFVLILAFGDAEYVGA